MKFTKKILASAVASSVLSVSGIQAVNAEIEIGKGLNVSGFVDMAYYYVDSDGPSTTKTAGIDQFELDFMFAGADGISAQVDIGFGGTAADAETVVEQAFITKQVSDSFSVKAGRFLAYSGWEAAEPTGLYQQSAAPLGGEFYGGYQQGVSAYYDAGKVDLMFSVVNDVFNGSEYDTQSLGIEAGVALELAEGLTTKLFYLSNEDSDIVNFWTSYETGGFTFAFEYGMRDYADEAEGDGFLALVNYAAGPYGVTLRYHDLNKELDGMTLNEESGITFAPSYTVSDNLLLVAEYRMDDSNGSDVETLALEALFTF